VAYELSFKKKEGTLRIFVVLVLEKALRTTTNHFERALRNDLD